MNFNSYQLKIVLPTDFYFFAIPLLDRFIVKMLLTVQFNGEQGQLLASAMALINHKVKPTGIKQIQPGQILREHL